MKKYLTTILYACIFGFILIKAEVLSWFRIYEMFSFQSFHMFGVLLSAIFTAMILILLLKNNDKEKIEKGIKKRKFNKGTIIGGILFGMGWGLSGLCPGPIYIQMGLAYPSALILFISALVGAASFLIARKKNLL